MAISASLLKWYKSTTVSDAVGNGGVINTVTGLITTNSAENIFPNVTDAERVSGVTQYRKIFFRNENADSYANIKAWISQFTPATNDEISIVAGTASDTQADADDYTYVSPDSAVHADVLTLGTLAQNASASIWIKRVVSAGGDGYTGNSAIIAVVNS